MPDPVEIMRKTAEICPCRNLCFNAASEYGSGIELSMRREFLEFFTRHRSLQSIPNAMSTSIRTPRGGVGSKVRHLHRPTAVPRSQSDDASGQRSPTAACRCYGLCRAVFAEWK